MTWTDTHNENGEPRDLVERPAGASMRRNGRDKSSISLASARMALKHLALAPDCSLANFPLCRGSGWCISSSRIRPKRAVHCCNERKRISRLHDKDTPMTTLADLRRAIEAMPHVSGCGEEYSRFNVLRISKGLPLAPCDCQRGKALAALDAVERYDEERTKTFKAIISWIKESESWGGDSHSLHGSGCGHGGLHYKIKHWCQKMLDSPASAPEEDATQSGPSTQEVG